MNEEYRKVLELIKKSNSIYITAHIFPDGDAIGSIMALYLALKNMGKDVHAVVPKYSHKFEFLEELKYAEKGIAYGEYDLCICVDVSSLDRLEITEEEYMKAKSKIVIDHHLNSNIAADVLAIDSRAPATCEIIYEILEMSNISIDENIAKYLYMGILTDTGSFNYSNTTPKTHRIVARLIETGIDFAYICKMVNDTMKEGKLKLIAYAINNIETYNDGKIKYVKMPYSIIKELGIDEEDSEGIVNYLRCIEGVDIAICARQLEDKSYKVSMRSNGNVDISKAAISLGGGGHRNAAGFTVKGEIDNVKNEIIEVVGVNL